MMVELRNQGQIFSWNCGFILIKTKIHLRFDEGFFCCENWDTWLNMKYITGDKFKVNNSQMRDQLVGWIYFDEGLTLETSTLKSLFSGQNYLLNSVDQTRHLF